MVDFDLELDRITDRLLRVNTLLTGSQDRRTTEQVLLRWSALHAKMEGDAHRAIRAIERAVAEDRHWLDVAQRQLRSGQPVGPVRLRFQP